MMLGAHALRIKQQKDAERKEQERKDHAKELHKAAKRLGEAAQSILSERGTSSSRIAGNRAHSIYDFSILSARTSNEQNKNPKLKSRFSLNVGTMAGVRGGLDKEQPQTRKKRTPSGGSFQSLMQLTPRSMSGPANGLDIHKGRNRANSAQSDKTSPSSSSSSAFVSVGTRLLKWFGITSSSPSRTSGRNISQRKGRQQGKKCKRRQSAL